MAKILVEFNVRFSLIDNESNQLKDGWEIKGAQGFTVDGYGQKVSCYGQEIAWFLNQLEPAIIDKLESICGKHCIGCFSSDEIQAELLTEAEEILRETGRSD